MPEVMTEPGVTPTVETSAPVSDTITDPLAVPQSDQAHSPKRKASDQKEGAGGGRFQSGIEQALEEMYTLPSRLTEESDVIRLAALHTVPSALMSPLLERVRRAVMGAQARLLSEGASIGESDSVLDALRGAGIKATDAQLTALCAQMQHTNAGDAQELLEQAHVLQGYLRRVHKLSGSLAKLDKVLKIL
ncbi:MAG: hypothetical protein ACI8RZ_002325 [Myxococcota bacterium]|jgi:hypothetical protein